MLGDLKYKSVFDSLDLEGVEDGWDVSLKLHVDDGTDDLHRMGCTCEICPAFEENWDTVLRRLRTNIN